MSRAFIRERDDVSEPPPPELKISPHPNRVTRRGLHLIDARISAIESELAQCHDELREAWLRRDLRYWTQRRATAQVTAPPDPDAAEVAFGSRVTIEREGHAQEVVEIVGEDESDPATGHVSWVAPLALALMGAQAGETVVVGQRKPPLRVRVLAVENPRS